MSAAGAGSGARAGRAGGPATTRRRAVYSADRRWCADAKVAALAAGILARAASIEDSNLPRHGGMGGLAVVRWLQLCWASFLSPAARPICAARRRRQRGRGMHLVGDQLVEVAGLVGELFTKRSSVVYGATGGAVEQPISGENDLAPWD